MRNSFLFLVCSQNLKFAGMMQYDGDLKLPSNFLVPPPEIKKVGQSVLPFILKERKRAMPCHAHARKQTRKHARMSENTYIHACLFLPFCHH